MAINAGQALGNVFPCFFSCKITKELMDLLNCPCVLPIGEVVINQFPFGEASGKHAPLAACFEQIKDGIENVAQRMFSVAFVV